MAKNWPKEELFYIDFEKTLSKVPQVKFFDKLSTLELSGKAIYILGRLLL